MTMITRISTGSSSTVAQLLDGVLHKLVDEVVGYRGVGRPSAVAPHRAGHPGSLISRMASTGSPYCSARAPVPWLVDQRRPSVE
jgi:hypothetical protein